MRFNDAFVVNRTEEIPFDVLNQFVVPPYFDQISNTASMKPKFFIGGRGCGKTMLLRYLSHYTQFSPLRRDVPETALKIIGIYWRIDTQFAASMHKHGLEEERWIQVLRHYFAVNVAQEILASVMNLANSAFHSFNKEELLVSLDLAGYSPKLMGGIEELIGHLKRDEEYFYSWFNNIGKIAEPIFYPGDKFVESLISRIKEVHPVFKDSVFHIYIDEYENLLEYQQKYFNTLVKHSQSPLVVNIAAKKNGISTTKTLGEENIQDIADYRIYHLDELLGDSEFAVFTSEILLKRISILFPGLYSIPHNISEPADEPKRREPTYRNSVLAFMRKMFPGYSQSDLANVLFEDEVIVDRIRSLCENKLQFENEKADLKHIFENRQAKEAIIVLPALFSRGGSNTRIFSEFKKYCKSETSEFEGWVQNNFIGCYLWAYNVQNKIAPIYSGFDTMVLMSKGSIRHFLELAYKSLQMCEDGPIGTMPTVPQSVQSKAIRLVSSQLVSQIRSFGRYGNRLYSFLNSIGQIFFYSQMRVTQSEPEITHFSIQKEVLEKRDEEFLAEAEKWSVLFPGEETKVKSGDYSTSLEYVVHPIYSPYYLISYRKKRRLDLPYESFAGLAHGNADKQRAIIESFRKRIGEEDGFQQSLFNT